MPWLSPCPVEEYEQLAIVSAVSIIAQLLVALLLESLTTSLRPERRLTLTHLAKQCPPVERPNRSCHEAALMTPGISCPRIGYLLNDSSISVVVSTLHGNCRRMCFMLPSIGQLRGQSGCTRVHPDPDMSWLTCVHPSSSAAELTQSLAYS